MMQNPGNRGKGYAVRAGMLEAQGDVVLFTDSDLSSPIDEAERLFAPITAGADIAIGSRWLESSRQTHRQPLYRQFFGRCFNAVTRAVMGLPFADTQCGFKAFTREAAQTVFELQPIERWGLIRDPLHRPQARLQDRGGGRELGARQAHPHELSARRRHHAGRAGRDSLEFAHRTLRQENSRDRTRRSGEVAVVQPIPHPEFVRLAAGTAFFLLVGLLLWRRMRHR